MYIAESLTHTYKLIYKDESASSHTRKWVMEDWGVAKLAVEKPKLKLAIPKNIRSSPTYSAGKQ